MDSYVLPIICELEQRKSHLAIPGINDGGFNIPVRFRNAADSGLALFDGVDEVFGDQEANFDSWRR
jgi:hypothetical protein